MDGRHWRREHHDALAVHFVEAVLPAVLNGLFRFGALLHPHVLDARRIGFTHDFLGLRRRHDDQYAVHFLRQRGEAGVAPITLDGLDVAINRIRVVPFLFRLTNKCLSVRLPLETGFLHSNRS